MKKRITSYLLVSLCILLVSCADKIPSPQESTEKNDISADISIPEENDVSDGNSEAESEIPEVTDTRNDGFSVWSTKNMSSTDDYSITDGKFIYTLFTDINFNQKLIVHSVNDGAVTHVKETLLSDEIGYKTAMLYGDLIVLTAVKNLFYDDTEHSTEENQLRFSEEETIVEFYKHDGNGNITLVNSFFQSGMPNRICVENDMLYLITNYYFGYDYGNLDDMFWYDYAPQPSQELKEYITERVDSRLPAVGFGTAKTIDQGCVRENEDTPSYNRFVLSVFKPEDESVSTVCMDGSCLTAFVNGNNIYIRDMGSPDENTASTTEARIYKFTVTDGVPDYVCRTYVKGMIKGFREKDGCLTFVVEDKVENDLYNCHIDVHAITYDASLNENGRVKMPDTTREVKSSLFDGDTLYVMTYGTSRVVEHTAMTYTIDISDSTAPRITASVKTSGYLTELALLEEGRLFGFGHSTKGRKNAGIKLGLFDISASESIKEISSVSTDKSLDLNRHILNVDTENKTVLVRYRLTGETIEFENYDWTPYGCIVALYSYAGDQFKLLGQREYYQQDSSGTRNIGPEQYTMDAVYIDGYYYVISYRDEVVNIYSYSADNFTLINACEQVSP